jgi:hypothetical protein
MKAGVSFSNNKDSFYAGWEAASEAAGILGDPVLTIVFATDDYDAFKVLSGVKSAVKFSRIAGFCCGGVITEAGVHLQGVGVVVLSGNFHAETTIQKGLSKDPYAVGKKAGRTLMKYGKKSGTVIVMPDGFQVNVSEMLRGLYNQLGPGFQYIGGGAGDNLKFFKTYQFTEDDVAEDALVVALLEGVDIGVGIGHGWRPIGAPMVITRVKGKRVYEIDGVSAFSAYSSRMGNIIRAQFPYQSMMHPLGFPNISGQYIIRDPLSVNEDDSIDFVTEIPSQAVGNIMDCEIDGLIETAKNAAHQARSSVADPVFMLLFDCISRSLLIGDRFHEEIRVLREAVGLDVPILGALTFGEVGSYENAPLFHNKTTVVAVGSGKCA